MSGHHPWSTIRPQRAKHRAPAPSGPFTIEIEFDGRISVCDSDVNALATFDPEYRDFAEEMRDRLAMRELVRKTAEQPRCPNCGQLALAVRIPAGGRVAVYTHENGAEHQDLLAEMRKP